MNIPCFTAPPSAAEGLSFKGEEEKRTALKHILAHYIPGKFAEDQNSLPENACIFKLEVTELTCRENR